MKLTTHPDSGTTSRVLNANSPNRQKSKAAKPRKPSKVKGVKVSTLWTFPWNQILVLKKGPFILFKACLLNLTFYKGSHSKGLKQKSIACASKKNKTFHRKVFCATFHGSKNLFEKCAFHPTWLNYQHFGHSSFPIPVPKLAFLERSLNLSFGFVWLDKKSSNIKILKVCCQSLITKTL